MKFFSKNGTFGGNFYDLKKMQTYFFETIIVCTCVRLNIFKLISSVNKLNRPHARSGSHVLGTIFLEIMLDLLTIAWRWLSILDQQLLSSKSRSYPRMIWESPGRIIINRIYWSSSTSNHPKDLTFGYDATKPLWLPW